MVRVPPAVALGAVVCVTVGVSGGCMTRPVESLSPITHTNFVNSIPQGIDKVDLLFDIDNSASMGDKQQYLSQAIPDLIARLVTPNCVDPMGHLTGTSTIDGKCSDGSSTPEFPPVHDLHVGIVSSSLGNRGGTLCRTPETIAGTNIQADNDDHGRLIDRAGDTMDPEDPTESPLGAAEPDQFLNWFPSTQASANPQATGPAPITDPKALKIDFQQLVAGVHQFGCGIESQLESWYRFLIQPDPYESIGLDPSGKYARWVGVDNVILAQRAQFLRPDSLVMILVLTDENDSEVDVRALGGKAWLWMTDGPGIPRGTSACQSTDPTVVASDACTSCGYSNAPQNDPQCMKNGGYYTSADDAYDWGFDPNLRHVHERQKYGVSVQFPIERYVVGLTSPMVPNRDGEYPPANTPSGYAPSYQGLNPKNQACTNPLFAAKLPVPADKSSTDLSSDWANQLCHAPLGTRAISNVFYAHIGGVPHQLLQQRNPGQAPMPDAPQKEELSGDDWTLILGKDPENYDYSGIDPHMVESYQSRAGVTVPPGGFPVAGPGAAGGTDPISGREWVTDTPGAHAGGSNVDREYACTFKLTDATGKPTPHLCDSASLTAHPADANTCDCAYGPMAPLPHDEQPAVCNDTTQTQQDYAKAYPTIRELLLAKLLGQVPGANAGIVSSLCPIHTADMSTDAQPDLLYGYRPAMQVIADKLAKNLENQCLPQRLDVTVDPMTGQKSVACMVLGTFPQQPGSPTRCTSVDGYEDADPYVLAQFNAQQHRAWMAAGNPNAPDPSKALTCELKPLPVDVDCTKQTASQGWCYLSSGNKSCAQVILFTPEALKFGVQTTLQCLEASTNGDSNH